MAERGSECWQYPLLVERCRCSCSKCKSLSRKWLCIKNNAMRRLWRPNDTRTGPTGQTFWSSCTFQNIVSPDPIKIMLLGFGIGALSSKTNTITNLETNIHRACKNNSNKTREYHLALLGLRRINQFLPKSVLNILQIYGRISYNISRWWFKYCTMFIKIIYFLLQPQF